MTIAPGLRPLTRAELDVAVEWAAAEGWNPGDGDARVFWATDPGGFVGVDSDGELIATGSIVSYGGAFGFMGYLIVRPDLRGRGLGRQIWTCQRDALLERLRPGAAVGMDAVLTMQGVYAEAGFRASHRTLSMRGVGAAADVDTSLRDLADLPFAKVAAFDRRHFGAERPAFLDAWIAPPGGLGLGIVDGGRLRAIGVARPCREGFRIGPLFADDASCAARIYAGLGRVAAGEPVYLDVPDNNPAALALAGRLGLHEIDSCARMYLGAAPQLPWDRIFAITTCELG